LVNLPKLSIAARLYTIFALMAATTVALSVVAVSNSREHAALTEEFESANSGSWNVERINGLIYATVMDSRGIYMSADKAEVAKYADSLVKDTEQISAVIADWQRGVRNSDALAFSNFAVRINDYQDSLYKLAPFAKQSGAQAAREWADKNQPAEIRAVLSKDLAKLSQHYTDRASRIYTKIDQGIDSTALLLSVLACSAVALALAGAAIIARSVTKPISAITSITEAVAGGDSAIAIPFSDRRDEIGALARSIGVFQTAMRQRSRIHEYRSQGARRSGCAYWRRGQAHHRYRRANQSARVKRHHRSGTRRRSRTRIRRCGWRSESACRADQPGNRGNWRANCRHAARNAAFDRGDHRHRAYDPGSRQYQQRHRRRGHRAGRSHAVRSRVVWKLRRSARLRPPGKSI
jgi:HAMP domain-containing protein